MSEEQYKFYVYEDIKKIQDRAYWNGVVVSCAGWVLFIFLTAAVIIFTV